MNEEMQELVISRVFDAPRELVYKAFTDPDQLSAWFGPVGYSVPRDTVSVDTPAARATSCKVAGFGGAGNAVMAAHVNPA